MDSIQWEIAKWAAGLISTAVSVVIWLGKRQDKANEKIQARIKAVDDRVTMLDKENAQEHATQVEDVKRLREKQEQERIDFRERLKDITDYMYNRPR